MSLFLNVPGAGAPTHLFSEGQFLIGLKRFLQTDDTSYYLFLSDLPFHSDIKWTRNILMKYRFSVLQSLNSDLYAVFLKAVRHLNQLAPHWAIPFIDLKNDSSTLVCSSQNILPGDFLSSIVCFKGLTKIDFKDSLSIVDAEFAGFQSLPLLRELNFEKCKWLTDKHLSFLSSVPKLVYLDFTDTVITEIGLTSICKLPLTTLSLRSCRNVKNLTEFIKEQVKIHTLEYLRLASCRLDDAHLGPVYDLDLLGLDLADTLVSDDFLRVAAAKLKRLKFLDLSFCSRILASSISYFEHSHTLTTLDLSCTALDDNGFKSIPRSVSKLNVTETQITDASSEYIGNLSQLDVFVAKGCNLSDKFGIELKKLIHLEKLVLEGMQITDLTIAALAQLDRLKNLDVSFTLITNEAFKMLPGSIKYLYINDCCVKDAGAVHLFALPYLQLVSIKNCNISKGLKELLGCEGVSVKT